MRPLIFSFMFKRGDSVKRLISIFLTIILLFCFSSCKNKDKKQKFSESFIDYFDTVASVTGYCDSLEEFNKISNEVERMLKEYHELFDIYNTYSGVNNLATINAKAGIEPVSVDDRIIDLLEFSKEMYAVSKGYTDVTLGAILKIWHEKRSEGIVNPEIASLPDYDKLRDAALLRGFDKIIIDNDNNMVFIKEEGVSLDVGAVAKGYATEMIAKQLESKGIFGFALNIGGNIRVIGNKPDNTKWTAAVKNPNGDGYLMNINMDENSFVTSGSYQRFYIVEDKRYHHIINPDTLYPGTEFSSVSVMTSHSGIADCLSTALFSMSLEDGKKLVESLEGTEALWVTNDGELVFSSSFDKSVIKGS